tara:strand:- start:6501 stop:6719 length:219 start_codon:yes stop_codon:yes gene_type:complete
VAKAFSGTEIRQISVESDKCWGQSARRVFEKLLRNAKILLGVKKVVVEARVKSCEANPGREERFTRNMMGSV